MSAAGIALWLRTHWKLLLAAGVVLGLAIAGWRIYGKGEKAGAADVTNKVQGETIRKVDQARQDKVKADEKVRDTPVDAVIDGLR